MEAEKSFFSDREPFPRGWVADLLLHLLHLQIHCEQPKKIISHRHQHQHHHQCSLSYLLPGRLYEVSANRQLCGVDTELARVLLHNLIRALMRIISIVIAVTIDITVNVVIILMMLT